MKLQLVLILSACVVLQAAPFVEERSLQDDLQDFLSLIPFEKIKKVVEHYLANDAEVQEAFEYLKSDEFAAAWKYAIQHPDVLEIIQYLQDGGLDIVQLLNRIAGLLGLDQLQESGVISYLEDESSSSGGVKALVQEVIDLLPLPDIMMLFFEKMETSEDFQRLMERIQSADFQKIVDFVESSPEMLAIIDKLESLGFDVEVIVDFIKSFFGW